MMRIGQWQVCPDRCSMHRDTPDGSDAETVKVTPRAMDVLVYLTEHPHEVVSTKQLLDTFWPAPTTTDHAVHKVIASLRSALGDDPHEPTYIKTLPRRGYMLIATVAPLEEETQAGIQDEVPGEGEWQRPKFRLPQAIALLVVASMLMLAAAFLLPERHSSVTTPLIVEAEEAVSERQRILVLRPLLSQAAPLTQQEQVNGLLDSLAARLAQMPELDVLLSDPGVSARQSVEDSDATYSLESVIYHTGDKLRLTVNLTDVASGHHLYARQFVLEESALAPIEQQIIPSLVESLRIHLDEERLAEMRAWGTHNAQAYQHFQRAGFFRRQGNHADWQQALQHYEKAIELDPDFINAYLGKATAANNMAVYSRNAQVEELSREVLALSRRLAMVAPESEALDTLNSIRMRIEGRNEAWQERKYREQILAGTAPGYVYSRYALFLIGARMYHEANAFLQLAQTTESHRITPNEAWNFRTQTLPPEELADVKVSQLIERPVHIGILGTAISSLAFHGDMNKARYFLERQTEHDAEGVRAHLSATLVAAREDKLRHRECWLFSRENLQDPDLAFNNGILHFLLGEFEQGAEYWRNLTRIDKRKLFTRLHAIEPHLPLAILEDPRYAELLEELKVGRDWQKQLMEGVMAMTEYTGIDLHPLSREHYNEDRLMLRNNLWDDAIWQKLETARPDVSSNR